LVVIGIPDPTSDSTFQTSGLDASNSEDHVSSDKESNQIKEKFYRLPFLDVSPTSPSTSAMSGSFQAAFLKKIWSKKFIQTAILQNRNDSDIMPLVGATNLSQKERVPSMSSGKIKERSKNIREFESRRPVVPFV